MSEARKSAVANLAIQILLPFAELLLRARIGMGDFVALAKLAFVQAAADRMAGSPGGPNVSRIAVATGLTRREVSTILKQRKAKPLPFRRGRARAERVLSGWWNDPEFLGADGKPAVLPLRGPAPSLLSLVQRYSGSERAQPIVDELLRAKAIKPLASGHYRAIKRSCVNITWEPASLAELGLQLRTHFDALLQNLDAPAGEAQFARFFESGPIDAQQARVLLRDLKGDGELFLESATDRLSRKPYAARPAASDARVFSIAVQVTERPVKPVKPGVAHRPRARWKTPPSGGE